MEIKLNWITLPQLNINTFPFPGVKHIFLVGGFAESPMLQQEIRKNFAHQARILIPTDVSLTILKGEQFKKLINYNLFIITLTNYNLFIITLTSW